MNLGVANAAQSAADPNGSGYVRAGPTFACRLTPEDALRQDQHRDFPEEFPCMHIGPLEMEMFRSDAEKILGPPFRSTMDKGREVFIYDLKGDGSGAGYVVLTFKANGRVDSLQLTGDATPRVWRFSGMTTGDSQQLLASRFGQPSILDDHLKPGVTIWDYNPWTFSFELKDGRIWSIIIWEQ